MWCISWQTKTRTCVVIPQTTVRAPISGRVGQRIIEVGMRVDAQSPLLIIGRLDSVRIEYRERRRQELM